MSNYSGVVRKIFPKSNWGSYSFAIDSADKVYFNLGKVPPNFSEGQTLNFEGTPGKRPGNVDVNVNSIVIDTEAPVKPASYSMSQDLSKDQYWKNKEARDIENDRKRNLGAATNTAIAYGELLHKVTPFANVSDLSRFVEEKAKELASA